MDRTPLHDALAKVAPGTQLRAGLDRIVRARMGALVVLGAGDDVLELCSGGFTVDAPYSPQRLSELAKMDGAIIVCEDISRIARANVHLLPDPTTATTETGMRHRTAERTARSLRTVPVMSVSEDMSVITVYVGDARHVLEDTTRLISRSNQALQTLERYKARLDQAAAALSDLEIEDLVRVRDVATLLQRTEMVRRIADELETYAVELGTEARLIRIQLDELMGDVEDDRHAVIDDYLCGHAALTADEALERLAAVDTDDLSDLRVVAGVLCLPEGELDTRLAARGYRMLQRIPDLDATLADRLVSHFGSVARMQRATAEELSHIDGIDSDLATHIRGDLNMLHTASLLSRH